MSGRFHRSIETAHQRYGITPPTSLSFSPPRITFKSSAEQLSGTVFRVSPNELSFSSSNSWKGIYGTWPSQPPLVKSAFYEIFGAGFSSSCIGSERDPARYSHMRLFLAPAFSVKALSGQEKIVQSCVDGFIRRLKSPGGTDQGEKGMDMTVWYEMLAFDILGEMAFGESFHCVESGEPHFRQQMIAKHLYAITLVDNLRRYPVVRWIGVKLLPWLTTGAQKKHSGYSRARIARWVLCGCAFHWGGGGN